MRNSRLLLGIVLLCAASPSFGEEEAEEAAIRAAVESVAASVVRIETLGGREKIENQLVAEGPTTGLVIDAEGYLVSSSFNFAHDPASILVTTADGKRSPAKIVARDRARMLVLLKIATDAPLPVPEFAPASDVRVGQYAIAVGRALQADVPNLSVGVVSALGRASGRAVQTDAKISPNNYGGPLIDIHGRVLGVLTPLPVMGDGELSGAQFYDSGIGFAATLDAWQSRLDSLKAGHDLAPGLMGISLKPGDVYVLPAEVAVCQLHSPAYKAGLRAGDKIVEVDGRRIQRQMQLRHALGPHYAGDTVAVTVEREGKRIETSIELVERLEPFEYPLLGVLPMRERRTDGVVVRHVYAGSGADEAGMKPGDRIVEAGGQTVKDVLGLQQFVASHDPSQALAVKVQRGAETLELSVKLGKLNTELAKDLPAAVAAELAKPAEAIETGLVDARLPEEKQECWLYVPESYHPGVEHGLVIWYAPPGKFEKAEIERQWKKLADEHRLLVLVPRPGEAGQWNPSEVAVVRKFADNVLTKYTVDRSRVVVHGRQAGGVMAWLTALAHRNLVRGVAPLEAPLPARATIENDPVQRLFVYSFSMKDSPASAGIEAGHQRLKAAKVPLTIDTAKADQEPTAAQLEAIVAWLDQLDRI